MEADFRGKSVDFIKFVQTFEEMLTKDVYKLTEGLPFLMREGNHRVIINRVEGDNKQCDSYVYDVNTSLLSDSNGQISMVVSYEDIGKLAELDKKISSYEGFMAADELAASAVHEIKNPLFSIRGFVQLLESSLNIDDKRREYTHIMVSELDRLHRLLDDFLTFSQNKQKKCETIDMKQLIEDTVNFLRPRFEANKLLLNVNIEDDMPTISGSSDQLKQALINLFHNSIDATGSGNGITVKALAEGNRIYISIKDEGTGISEEITKDVFKPFYTTKEKGTGLGLYITKKIIENHNGRIYYESSEGEGTTFFIEFSALK
jgi:signal transduction histidine kinase